MHINETPSMPQEILDMVDKKVVCTRSAQLYGNNTRVVMNTEYEVEECKMYLGCVPAIKLKGLDGWWSHYKFKVIN